MAQLAGYFDDSGSHDGAHACVVFGFVSTLEQWVKFELEWNALLALPQFDLGYLHMAEFRGRDGRFAKFQNDLELQKQFFTLVQELGRRREAPGLQLADYGAWESHRAVNAWVTEGIENAKLRGSFRALMERFGIADNWTISDESSLRELCESQRIPKRTT